MDEKKQAKSKKNPLGAAVLSTLCPGVGFFYLGNYIKGIAYFLVFISLIVLASNSRGHEIPVFVLMSVGFYIFQIFDSFDEAKKIGQLTEAERKKQKQQISLFIAVAVLVVGVVFQLANLDIISFRQVTRLWPLVLIALGAKYIFHYLKQKEDKEVNGGGQNE